MSGASPNRVVPVGGRGGRVVVGVDGSPDSIAALRAGEWAAAARGDTLVACAAWSLPPVMPYARSVVPELMAAATSMLHAAIDAAFHGRCLVPVDTLVRPGLPAAVLVEQSRDADLLVVGSRGRGGFLGLRIGSVGTACAMHARCPVLVLHDGTVPAPGMARRGGQVVVGVGGGPAATVVLRTAAAAAREMDAALVAVAAWEDATRAAPEREPPQALAAQAQRILDAAIAGAFPDGRPPRLVERLREGPPSRVLVEESATADLVVVGRSGRSEFAGLLRGSVAMPVAAHADCPVLIVPSGAHEDRARGREERGRALA